MNTNPTFVTGALGPGVRFVLVNHRAPRGNERCALCGGFITNGYVRNSQTRLIYCDTRCFAGGATHRGTEAVNSPGRKAS